MKAFITGASGFIAAHLARRLIVDGYSVHGLVRPTSNRTLLNGLDIKFVTGDVTDPESLIRALHGIDVVFHLAGLTKAVRPEALDSVNVEGTRNIAEACVQCGVKRLVHVSSLAAAGPSRAVRGIRPIVAKTESDPVAPVSNYGRSKLESERRLMDYANRTQITILRPPIVFGEGDSASLQIFSAIQKTHVHAVPWPLSRLFSVIHAADLAELIVRSVASGELLSTAAADSEANGTGVYFADVGEVVTYGELGQRMATAMNVKCTIMPVPRVVLAAVGLLADMKVRWTGKASVISFDKAREATVRGMWICDGTKARDAFGYAPTVSFQDRLQQTVQWYRQHEWLD